MVFYLIGLGLGDVEDITVKGLNAIRKCEKVYLEAYTSVLCYGLSKTQLETFYGRPVIEADRNFVEEGCEGMLDESKHADVAMLVVGDPFGATTHADLALRAKQKQIEVRVIHNASIMNAVGCCGLQLYSFGATISMVFWTETWQPDSYYEKILMNRRNGLHTLCLLDIKTKEQSVENLMRGRKIYEPARYMTCAQAAEQLLVIAKRRKEQKAEIVENNEIQPSPSSTVNEVEHEVTEKTNVVGLARVGWNQEIKYCSLKEMSNADLGEPLHALIIPGRMHEMELAVLETYRK